jgi:hypothetical protein
MEEKIKASELRLGNLIYNTKGEVDTVTLEALDYLVDEDKHHQAKPIELTEEWLIKFMFQYLSPIFVISPDSGTTQFRITLQNGGTAALNHPDKNGALKNNDALLMGGNVIIPKCPEYVHELQNLYFALTGKELEIK